MKSNDDYKILIGLNILKYRRLNGLTQEKLAEKVTATGISRNYMQRIERGGNCSLDMILEIAKALDIPAKKLFEFDD